MKQAGLSAFIAFLALFAASSAPASDALRVDRGFYPFYPSLVKWEASKAPFTEPGVCAGCHPQQYAEWSGSVHALAFQDPLYQGELNKGFKAAGHEVMRQCEGCHAPAGMVTGEIKGPGLKGLGPLALAGVSCDICHSVSGVTHLQTPTNEPENGSFILAPGTDTRDGYRLVKRAPFKPSQGCGNGFHECAESSLHLTSELCAGCHQVYQYESHFPLEATYLEWKHGPYAQKGIQCQDCHMVDTATFIRTADTFRRPARSEYRHFFSGANYLLYTLAGEAARKAGNTQLAASLEKKYQMAMEKLLAAADLELFPVYRGGVLAEIKVRVRNVRAGHNLPTSLTNVRELWLEVTARDASGAALLSSGGFEGPGMLDRETRMFNSEGMGADFHEAIDPWVVTAFTRHDTIPPRGYKDAWFGVAPAKRPGPVTVEARLRYRQASQQVARKLLREVPEDISIENIYGISPMTALPVVDMVVKKASFGSREK